MINQKPSEERSILTLISKLNDRNIQKKRESGFTLYALVSVLGIVLYKLMELLPNLLNSENLEKNIYIITIFINIYFAAFLIYLNHSIVLDSSHSSKILSKNFSYQSILVKALLNSISLFPLALNGISTFLFIYEDSFNIYFFLNFLVHLIISVLYIKHNRKRKKHKCDFDFIKSKDSKSDLSISSIITYTSALLIIIGSIIYIYISPIINIEENNLKVLKAGVFLYTIPILMTYILDQKKTSWKNDSLENLEIEIYLQNLTNDRIIEKLEKDYLGIGMSKWIDKQIEINKDFYNETLVEIDKIKEFEIETKEIDKKYPREIEKRKSESEDEKFEVLNLIKEFYNKRFDEVEMILNKGIEKKSEKLLLRKLVDDYSDKYRSLLSTIEENKSKIE